MSQSYYIEKCQKCERSRLDGWVLVDGLCLACGPEKFASRRAKLLEQAAELLDQAQTISVANIAERNP